MKTAADVPDSSAHTACAACLPYVEDGGVLTADDLYAFAQALQFPVRWLSRTLGHGWARPIEGRGINTERSVELLGTDALTRTAMLRISRLRAVGRSGAPIEIEGPLELPVELQDDGPTSVFLSTDERAPRQAGARPTTAVIRRELLVGLTPFAPSDRDGVCIARVLDGPEPALDPRFLGRAFRVADHERMTRRAQHVLARIDAMDQSARATLIARRKEESVVDPLLIALATVWGPTSDSLCCLQQEPLAFVDRVGNALARIDGFLRPLSGMNTFVAEKTSFSRLADEWDAGPAYDALDAALDDVAKRFEEIVGHCEARPLCVESVQIRRIHGLYKEWHRIQLNFEAPVGEALNSQGRSWLRFSCPAARGHQRSDPIDARWSFEASAYPGGTGRVSKIVPEEGRCSFSFQPDEIERESRVLVVFVESHLAIENAADVEIEAER